MTAGNALMARPLVPEACILGEGIQWDRAAGRVRWTDVQGRRLHDCAADGSDHRRVDLPARVSAFALDAAGGMLCAFEDGIGSFDPASGARVLLHRFEPDLPTTRLNDGRCDRAGRFLVGGVEEKGLRPISSVISYDGAGPPRTLIRDVGCANSIAFSPDGSLMYFADTAGQDIFVYDYDQATGEIANRRVFATLDRAEGRPDGSCVDAQGRLWNALFGSGRVQAFNPDGSRGPTLFLPSARATCPCFGGPGLGTLYVTTARILMTEAEKAAMPEAGTTYAFDAGAAFGATGLPESLFGRPVAGLVPG